MGFSYNNIPQQVKPSLESCLGVYILQGIACTPQRNVDFKLDLLLIMSNWTCEYCLILQTFDPLPRLDLAETHLK